MMTGHGGMQADMVLDELSVLHLDLQAAEGKAVSFWPDLSI